MKRVVTLVFLVFVLTGISTGAVGKDPSPEIMGIRLGMSRDNAHTRLQAIGSLEKEARKRQEVWLLKDPRISHLLVGFDPDFRVRYVTAIAHPGGPHIRYEEVADLKRAQRVNNQGNYKFTWEVSARRGQPAYLVMAHGRDPQYLETYSVKRVDQKEAD